MQNTSAKNTALLWLLAILPFLSHGYKMFQERLPNGRLVPHPCKPNYMWKGVGHKAIEGGGARNPFGIDFAENGFKWDRCLCMQDSDGDGRTNGEELGDPDCNWTPGDAPKHKFGLSHPGICEPLNDPECQRRNTLEVQCEPLEEYTCDAIKSPDVRNITLRFPPTQVPAQETTYICMTFELPDDEEYHLVAYEPVIDNEDVMHHMLLFGCVENAEVSIAPMDSPEQCDMIMDGCEDILALWALGAGGVCLHEGTGIRIGKNGYKVVNLQHHWTNPSESTQYTDSSGMTLYYTPALRKYDATVLRTGQDYLQIPPGKKSVNIDGICGSGCTSLLPEPVYITSAVLHMHYLGHAGHGELWRDGKKVQDIVKTDDYDYDHPDLIHFDPPIELQPGDEVRVRCTFNSWNQDSITFFGDSSYDEMCYLFLIYYPGNPYFINCAQYHTFPECSLDYQPLNDTEFSPGGYNGTDVMDDDMSGAEESGEGQEECDFDTFSNDLTVLHQFQQLGQSCDPKGASCYPGCKEKIDTLRQYPCMKGLYGLYVESDLAGYSPEYAVLRMMLHSCDTYDNLGDVHHGDDHDHNYNRTINVCPFGKVDEGDGTTDGSSRGYAWISLNILILAGHMAVIFF